MIKKVNKLLVIVIIAVASIIEVGCTQSKNDNFKTGGSEQSMESTVDEGEISITNESDTISTGGEEGIEQEAVVESETEGAEQKRESIAIETAPVTRDDTILYGSIKTIDGFQMVDGTDVPVQVSFNVTNVQEGESAYKTLISGNAEIPKAENGMEYVVVTLNVTYDGGMWKRDMLSPLAFGKQLLKKTIALAWMVICLLNATLNLQLTTPTIG